MLSQREAAEQAGFSKRQQVTAVRVANVPEPDFVEQVDKAENPATVTKLAEQGRKPRYATLCPLSVVKTSSSLGTALGTILISVNKR